MIDTLIDIYLFMWVDMWLMSEIILPSIDKDTLTETIYNVLENEGLDISVKDLFLLIFTIVILPIGVIYTLFQWIKSNN